MGVYLQWGDDLEDGGGCIGDIPIPWWGLVEYLWVVYHNQLCYHSVILSYTDQMKAWKRHQASVIVHFALERDIWGRIFIFLEPSASQVT